MPGRGSYGPGGKWVHDRAKRVMDSTTEQYGEEKGKRVAYAIANLQGHRVGKTPKRGNGPGGAYGTPEAKKKARSMLSKPRGEYQKTASSVDFDEDGPLPAAQTGAAEELERLKSQYSRPNPPNPSDPDKTAAETHVYSLGEKVAKLLATGMSAGGRDNRTPYVGSTQFPTEGSKDLAGGLLAQSQGSAEVGPSPSFSRTSKDGIGTLQDASVKMPSDVGSLPKMGASVKNPLIEYLKTKQGQAEMEDLGRRLLETNVGDMPLGPDVKEQTSEPVTMSDDLANRSKDQIDAKLKELFERYPTEKAVIS